MLNPVSYQKFDRSLPPSFLSFDTDQDTLSLLDISALLPNITPINRSLKKITRRRWKESELEHLKLFYGTSMPVRIIAKELKRSEWGIRSKAYKLGLRRPFRGLLARAITEQCKHITRGKTGRILWNDEAVSYLAKLWERLYTPTIISKILKVTPGAISEAARRAGLPPRDGLPLLSSIKHNDPMSAPVNQVIKSQMIARHCIIKNKLFFVTPKDSRNVFYSYQAKQILKKISRPSVLMSLHV